MDSVVETRGTIMPHHMAKRSVLALRIADPGAFKSMIAAVSTVVGTSESHQTGGVKPTPDVSVTVMSFLPFPPRSGTYRCPAIGSCHLIPFMPL